MAQDIKTAARLGPALRALRKQNDWTLADVSSRTGLPISTLSKVENDKLSLSYDKLVRLSEGLQVDIAQLFSPGLNAPEVSDGPRPFGRRSVQRSGEGNFIETKNYTHFYPAAELLQKKLVPIIAELHVRSLEEFGELIKHTGEEYAIVLDGACELHTELYAPLHLERGDSVYFDSAMGHAYVLAPGADHCTILSVCTSPEAQIREKFSPVEQPAAPKVTRASKPAAPKKRARA
ncbi:helix-turn-helix domain-containing protein [Roseiterribacter gracilis]|uniref:Transcriptional regulator n=1 Tax=Roseiterribacter gracilis TaxID=2812848 RepID=A0A8S8X6N4_9PROT|nr:transcriptional regulator [Rhodospirillales bacterium TMPK1]